MSFIKHGDRTKTYTAPEYRSWIKMKDRCMNINHHAFASYGGRGISVCDRWKDYENFLEDMGRKPSASHSLDRINNDAGYSKENCRWATKKEQGRNRRDNKIIEYGGRSLCAASWAEELGIPRNALYLRLKNGWDIARALSTPLAVHRRHV